MTHSTSPRAACQPRITALDRPRSASRRMTRRRGVLGAEAVRQFPGAVGAVVVDHDDFVTLAATARIERLRQPPHQLLDVQHLVVGRHDDREHSGGSSAAAGDGERPRDGSSGPVGRRTSAAAALSCSPAPGARAASANPDIVRLFGGLRHLGQSRERALCRHSRFSSLSADAVCLPPPRGNSRRSARCARCRRGNARRRAARARARREWRRAARGSARRCRARSSRRWPSADTRRAAAAGGGSPALSGSVRSTKQSMPARPQAVEPRAALAPGQAHGCSPASSRPGMTQ